MNFVEGSLLGDIQLRPHVPFAKACRFDPMHTYFSGIFPDEMFRFIVFCCHLLSVVVVGRGEDAWSSLKRFCNSGWHWPVAIAGKGKAISEMFSACRKKSCIKAKTFKCGASEALTCFPLARRCAELCIQEKCIGSPELHSCYACCDAMACLLYHLTLPTIYSV